MVDENAYFEWLSKIYSEFKVRKIISKNDSSDFSIDVVLAIKRKTILLDSTTSNVFKWAKESLFLRN